MISQPSTPPDINFCNPLYNVKDEFNDMWDCVRKVILQSVLILQGKNNYQHRTWISQIRIFHQYNANQSNVFRFCSVLYRQVSLLLSISISRIFVVNHINYKLKRFVRDFIVRILSAALGWTVTSNFVVLYCLK